MDVGLRSNRAVLLQQFISQGDHTLRPGFEYWITGEANLWIPATSPSDSKIVVNNTTTNTLTITSNGGTPISGVTRSSGTALSGSDRVRILPGQQASFVMSDRGWITQGCEPVIAVDPLSASLALALPLSVSSGLVDRAPEIRVASGLPSVAAKTITSFGSPSVTNTRFMFYGAALGLDGTTQYLSTGSLSAPADFCVEGWAWIDSTQTAGYVAALGSFEIDISATQVRLSVFGTISNALTASYTANQWLHLAFYRASGSSRLAVNGVVSTPYSNSSAISGAFTLGRRSLSTSTPLKGSVQDWRVYIGVAKYGSSNFTPPEAIYL